MALFQYMIGNTDRAVEYLHNIKLPYKDAGQPPYPVPYNFNYAGTVSAPFTLPCN